jgi:hypothetical protein
MNMNVKIVVIIEMFGQNASTTHTQLQVSAQHSLGNAMLTFGTMRPLQTGVSLLSREPFLYI